jgi:hypothetical protein
MCRRLDHSELFATPQKMSAIERSCKAQQREHQPADQAASAQAGCRPWSDRPSIPLARQCTTEPSFHPVQDFLLISKTRRIVHPVCSTLAPPLRTTPGSSPASRVVVKLPISECFFFSSPGRCELDTCRNQAITLVVGVLSVMTMYRQLRDERRQRIFWIADGKD